MFLSASNERVKTPLSTMAVISLMAAVTGPLVIVGFPVGIVLAHLALTRISRARKRGEEIRGRGFAIAALWLSYGFLAFFAIAGTVFIVSGIVPPS